MLMYNELQQDLGTEFIIKSEVLKERLVKNPHIYQVRKKELRLGLLESFPYQFIYQIINKDIVEYGVIHGRKAPRKKYQLKKIK